MKIKDFWIEDFEQYEVNEEKRTNATFVMVLKKGLHKKYYRFKVYLPYIKICYLQDRGFENAPVDIKENREILTLAYGEFKKQLAMWELQADFRAEDEEKERKRREEEQGKIKIGEQVSFEKYLKNFKKTIDNEIL